MAADDATLDLARQYCGVRGNPALLPGQAKLYSQHIRLRALGQGLQSWKPSEAGDYLDEAVCLLSAAELLRDTDASLWTDAVRRSGELLEWLSQPELNTQRHPLRLLAAAAYQIAGYPARASGLWARSAIDEGESPLLRPLLRGDFPELWVTLVSLWSRLEPRVPQGGSTRASNSAHPVTPEDWVTREVAAALGVLASSMRWGEEERLATAIRKLEAVARFLLSGTDRYSWLLASLCSQVVHHFDDCSLRRRVRSLQDKLSDEGQLALERYLRGCYLGGRTVAWPTQREGIVRLATGASFALCTPTGSGKTAVAELAILRTLFQRHLGPSGAATRDEGIASSVVPSRHLALYLTPSRALAAEVESKLAATLRSISDRRIVVTGLYGGTDWGPSDAWLTLTDPTVLICTYEKAEALVRFLGRAFLPKVGLVILDEAHFLQCEKVGQEIRAAETRAYGAESLIARVLAAIQTDGAQVVALSAVAAGIERVLARWLADDDGAEPISVQYRSTRQLIGRLDCYRDGHYAIRYSLLDGNPLEFRKSSRSDLPFVLRPFPDVPRASLPDWNDVGPEVRLRPSAFWAALQLAGKDTEGNRHSVLVYLTQQPEQFAGEALRLLRNSWGATELPDYFAQPIDTDVERHRIWERCLKSCEDYFGEASDEYQLLLRGVILHKGKLPGSIARHLVMLVEEGIIQVVLATSTLAEGVNLPFETVLIPSLRRQERNIPLAEFLNVAGRAGRPGSGTEGQCLVVWDASDPGSPTRWRYEEMLALVAQRNQSQVGVTGQSALAKLLQFIESEYRRVTGSENSAAFLEWLETVAPIQESAAIDSSIGRTPADAVDSLDAFLIAALEDVYEVSNGAIGEPEEANPDLAAVEERITKVWRRTFARFAAANEAQLQELVVRRARGIVRHVYPDRRIRRQYYMSSLPPKQAKGVIDAFPAIREHLASGSEFAIWETERRVEYVLRAAELVNGIARFQFSRRTRDPQWRHVLWWWLDRASAAVQPRRQDVTKWIKYVDENFVIRLTWGLGSIIALAAERRPSSAAQPLSAEEWESVGLPWAAFWLKDMLTWGTLEAPAAYLLSCQIVSNRREAEDLARRYSAALDAGSRVVVSPNDRLNAIQVREWAESLRVPPSTEDVVRPPREIPIELQRNFSRAHQALWRVLPVERNAELEWCDPAGFLLATSPLPEPWLPRFLNSYDFVLDVERGIVKSYSYRRGAAVT